MAKEKKIILGISIHFTWYSELGHTLYNCKEYNKMY